MRNVTHIITGLSTGGAEMMLYKLLSAATKDDLEAVVISLMDVGTIGARIARLGVPVITLGMMRGVPGPFAAIRLIRTIRRVRPSVIQGWMYHGNLTATLAARSVHEAIPVLWNIRQSLYETQKERSLTRLTIKVGSGLSKGPVKIIYNSHISAAQHEALGYKREKTIVIPNGFDTDQFCPNSGARNRVREELGIPNDALAIGLVARHHPMKDHGNFLDAASLLLQQYQGVHFVLSGSGINPDNREIWKLVEKLQLNDNVHLLGEREDVPEILASLDIATSSSAWGEGFPNVIGEAMACGIPCVVTDVGDSAFIVGETGLVVPPGEPASLSHAWLKLIDMGSEERQGLGIAARQRVIERFSLSAISQQYQDLYEHVAYAKSEKRCAA